MRADAVSLETHSTTRVYIRGLIAGRKLLTMRQLAYLIDRLLTFALLLYLAAIILNSII